MLVDYDQGELCVKSARGFDEDISAIKVKIGEAISGLVAQTGEPILVKDIQQELRFGILPGPLIRAGHL